MLAAAAKIIFFIGQINIGIGHRQGRALRQLYVDAVLDLGATHEISGEDYSHLTRSLRVKIGEVLRLVDSDFSAFQGHIVAINRRSVSVVSDEKLPPLPKRPSLCLGLCAPASDAFDAALDAAVQLGVTEFVPLNSMRSRHLDASKRSRWQRIAKESCCQSLRLRPPEILEPEALNHFLDSAREGRRFLAWQGSPTVGRPKLDSNSAHTLLVGPEGGFDETELAMAKAAGWEFLRLGDEVLRVPVAVAAGLSVLYHLSSGTAT
jgi:16S rRNA (uracil1498-N3)-methyltransferase